VPLFLASKVYISIVAILRTHKDMIISQSGKQLCVSVGNIMKKDWDVIIIGAGAAGLFCAIETGKRGRSTLVLERAASGGKKIAISGGGRCNFSNLYATPEHFICRNSHFVKAALARFTPLDFVALVEKHGIPYHEKAAGQLFCSRSAQEILRLLHEECANARVEIVGDCRVDSVRKNSRFFVETNSGQFESRSLVIATGGLSYPQAGATDFGYRIAQQFNICIEPTRPALVPFVLSEKDLLRLRHLSGVSIEAAVRLHKQEFRDKLLFTHRGLSGPAILQISSYWNAGETIVVDCMPGCAKGTLFTSERKSPRELKTLLRRYWPGRFAEFWVEHHAISKPLPQYSKREQQTIENQIHSWEITPAGTEDYSRAEVTGGGVDTNELSSQTMEARRVRGLYFIGEVVDVTGQLGGFNLHWAWASAFAAGQAA
jgi:predicted Rossmann fold flavoprotein